MRIAIIGAGFGGIGMAIELRRHGLHDVVILERGPGLGGTWLYNDYPGAACDVPTVFYQYSFAPRRDWPRLCPERDEIVGYLRKVAREHDVERLVVPGVEVAEAAWDDGWTITASDGRSWRADALIVATGQLHHPSAPRLPGDFAGHSFHSAEWDQA
jgi:cation diffusion facilitator CzcD-associated flavoprotein CzcO